MTLPIVYPVVAGAAIIVTTCLGVSKIPAFKSKKYKKASSVSVCLPSLDKRASDSKFNLDIATRKLAEAQEKLQSRRIECQNEIRQLEENVKLAEDEQALYKKEDESIVRENAEVRKLFEKVRDGASGAGASGAGASGAGASGDDTLGEDDPSCAGAFWAGAPGISSFSFGGGSRKRAAPEPDAATGSSTKKPRAAGKTAAGKKQK
jgi:hypothetical protein